MTTEPAWYKLKEVEDLLRCSRDTVARFVQAGLLTALGTGRSRRITAASYRRLAALIDDGVDVWALLESHEKPPVRLPMAAAVSSTTNAPRNGTSSRPHQKAARARRDTSIQPRKRPDWIKKIT